MKFDVTKVPLGEALIGFVLVAVVVTFVLAFALPTGSGIEDEAAGGETVAEEPAAAADETPSDGAASGDAIQVEVAMIPIIMFDVDEIAVPGGQTVTLTAENLDTGIPHNWAFYTSEDAALGGESAIAGTPICVGCTETVTFDAPDPGEYFFRCDVHPIQMVGTFTVE